MRLLNTKTLRLKEFVSTEGVKYAILSHRWEDEEVSLQQLVVGDVRGKLGYVKIQRFCGLAAKDGYEWAWVDTCCIDKSSSAELQEAINSMYRWYRDADLCYVYLSDVKSVEDLGKSAWFTRGWTLQEMIVCCHLFIGSKDFYADNYVLQGPRQRNVLQLAMGTHGNQNVVGGSPFGDQWCANSRSGSSWRWR
jgi:hypothetical protein